MFLRSGNRLRSLSSPPLLGTSQVTDDQSESVSSHVSEVTDTRDYLKASAGYCSDRARYNTVAMQELVRCLVLLVFWV
ncbi:hypothetical protein PILCRDRAFT_823074 [Piloderma croceum F 1598]|uniref:Uncharacterized protein n=1 Tax=Piloderma croceum (strain F 1598) TaxID=765440 RepID=A0A0C3F5B8_PILCF|nr:hypothetical protein PILCRDRAFT_823074 [Piloderma croceum F 1598]